MAWPVRVAPVGSASMGAVMWRIGGQLMVTVIVKTDFVFVADGVMMVARAAPVIVADEYEGGHILRSRETAPQLTEVDVTLIGSAYPLKAGAAESHVRLGLHREGAMVLDKQLVVHGDRPAGGAPAPFTCMPLIWERTFGGIGYADNPLGTGYGKSTAEPPNVLYPGQPARPAGFAPIPVSFPVRRRRLGPKKRLALEGIVDIPMDFDWGYFQASPPDQRLAALHGDEWVMLEGFSAEQPRMRSQLPGGKAVTRIYGGEAAQLPIDRVPLRADSLHIDADAMTCTVCWRGSFPIAADRVAHDLVIAGGYELPQFPLVWPEASKLVVVDYQPNDAPPSSSSGTLALQSKKNKPSQTLPFKGYAKAPPSAITLTPHPSVGGTGASLPKLPPELIALAEAKAAAAAKAAEAERVEAEARERAAREQAAEDAAAREAAARQAAAREAEERRQADAERFRREQEELKQAAEVRAREDAARKKTEAATLRHDMYGSLKRKKK